MSKDYTLEDFLDLCNRFENSPAPRPFWEDMPHNPAIEEAIREYIKNNPITEKVFYGLDAETLKYKEFASYKTFTMKQFDISAKKLSKNK